jgi:hypothetical protein
MLVHGGRKGLKKSMKNRSIKYRKRGGCGLLPLSPAPFDGVGTSSVGTDVNFVKQPTYSTTQVGGGMGYGYDSGAEANTYGGNYFPITRACTAPPDPSRGGNNFMSGGHTCKRRHVKSGGRKSKRSGSKRSGSKRGGTKKCSGGKRKRSSKCGGKKWKQRGCNKKGGFIPI